MHNRTFAAVLVVLSFTALPVLAQAPAPSTGATPSKFVSIVGTVTKVGDGAKTFGIKPDKGDETTVMVNPRTSFLRIPAGETDIKKATKVQATDVGAGDRVLVRVQAENPTGLPAGTFVITKQADVAARNEKTLQEWQTQSVSGIVKSVDKSAQRIVIASRVAQGAGATPTRDVMIDLTGNVEYRRYDGDSGKYEPGEFDGIQTGDEVRLIGDKNADQTQIKARAIMSGAFRSIPVQIKSIDAATQTIQATDLATKKTIVVGIRPDTLLKKLDDATALAMARRLNPSFRLRAGGGEDAARAVASKLRPLLRKLPASRLRPIAQRKAADAGLPAGVAAPDAADGIAANDPNRVLENQPTIELNDLKAGDPIVVTGTMSADNAKIMAMSLVAGVDPILRAAPANGPDPLGGNWNFGGVAAPEN